jgi:hypothetical protein
MNIEYIRIYVFDFPREKTLGHAYTTSQGKPDRWLLAERAHS